MFEKIINTEDIYAPYHSTGLLEKCSGCIGEYRSLSATHVKGELVKNIEQKSILIFMDYLQQSVYFNLPTCICTIIEVVFK